MSEPGEYIEANGVNTYYEVHGEGQPLLALHGGFSSGHGFAGMLPALVPHFRVVLPDRRGHGRTPDVDGPMSYQAMADDTVALMRALGIGRAHIVGYSDGANIGMLMAMAQPGMIGKFVSISGNFDAGGLTERGRAFFGQSTATTFPAQIVEAYAELSPDGPAHWPVVFEKIQRMILNEPKIQPEDLGRIEATTLVLASDDDLMTLDHTVELFRAIPNAQLAIVPGASHLLLYEKPELVNQLVVDFLTKEPAKIDLGF